MLVARSFHFRASATARLLTLVPVLLLLVWTGAHAAPVAAAPVAPTSAQATISCGTGWHAVASPPISTNGSLLGVAAIPGTKQLWTVGYQSNAVSTTSLIERWNGSRWSVVPSPTVAGATVNLQAVTALSASDAWAVGEAYANPITTTVILHWNGSQWTLVPSPNPGSAYNVLNGVAALSANSVWAAGMQTSDPSNSNTQQLLEHWNGHTWSVATGANLSGYSTLAAIARIPGTAQLLATGSVANPTTGFNRTVIERWNGNAWVQLLSPNEGGISSQLFAITALSSRDAWAVGSYALSTPNYNGGSTPQTLIERFNGSVWKVVASPNVVNGSYRVENQLVGVTALSASTIFTVGIYTNPTEDFEWPLAERWNGSRWSLALPYPPFTPSPNYSLSSVTHVPGTSQVWAVGSDYPNGPDQPLIVARC